MDWVFVLSIIYKMLEYTIIGAVGIVLLCILIMWAGFIFGINVKVKRDSNTRNEGKIGKQ